MVRGFPDSHNSTKMICLGDWPTLPDMEINFEVTDNKRITKIPILGPQFSIEFSIKVNAFPSSGNIANIFHFTSTGQECCKVGDRVPAIFLDHRGRLLVAFPLFGDGEEVLKFNRKMVKNNWHKVKIIQDKVHIYIR